MRIGANASSTRKRDRLHALIDESRSRSAVFGWFVSVVPRGNELHTKLKLLGGVSPRTSIALKYGMPTICGTNATFGLFLGKSARCRKTGTQACN